MRTRSALPLFFTLVAILWAPQHLAAEPDASLPPVNTLVLIQPAGGNDGLATVIPFTDPAYAAVRATVAPSPSDLIKVSGTLALHPALAPLMTAWKAGDFAIALGATRPPGIFADPLILGETQAGPLKGPGMHNISLDKVDAFLRDAAQMADESVDDSPRLSYIGSVQQDIIAAAAVLAKIKPAIKEPSVPFPGTGLGRQMKTSFQLLAAGLRVPVVKLTLRGFDLHSGEKPVQERLLGELAGAVAAFRSNLVQAGLWDRVVIVTYSEFGRRVEENASNGTDHGTAAPVFILGGRVKGGLYGTEPSLAPADLDQGDVKYTMDFRTLYRTVWRSSGESRIRPCSPRCFRQFMRRWGCSGLRR